MHMIGTSVFCVPRYRLATSPGRQVDRLPKGNLATYVIRWGIRVAGSRASCCSEMSVDGTLDFS